MINSNMTNNSANYESSYYIMKSCLFVPVFYAGELLLAMSERGCI